MRPSITRRLATAGAFAVTVLAAACGGPATDSASSSASATHAARVDVKIGGTDGGETDQVAANSLADLEAYWSANMQPVFGEKFVKPKGGYWSVDPAKPTEAPCLNSPKDVENNAFYCFDADAIVYDRNYLGRIAEEYGDLDIALALAHEYGHVLQGRVPADSDRTIVSETQADCYAGAFAKAIADGDTPHFEFDSKGIDGVLADYIHELGDHPGTDPNDINAHGTSFDRVVALQDGFADGPKSCVTNYDDNTQFTATSFTAENDGSDGQGNADLDTIMTSGSEAVASFMDSQVSEISGGSFDAPALAEADSECGPDEGDAMTYCPDSNTVAYGSQKELADIHQQLGDFSVVTLFTMEYGDAVLRELGHDADDEAGELTASICVTGAFAGSLLEAGTDGAARLSPGDLDEAVTTLLLMGNADLPLANDLGTSAFDRIDAFSAGVGDGLASCGVS